MINQERLALGVAALRSGNYVQGTETLKKLEDGQVKHCCLGVFTDVAIEAGCENIRMTSGGTGMSGWYEVFTSKKAECSPECPECGDEMEWLPADRGTLHRQVQDWYGFEEANPGLKDTDGGFVAATSANDTFCWSFSRIADAFQALGEENVQPG